MSGTGTFNGSRSLTRLRYVQARAELGDEHPKTRALLGRLRALTGWVPQRSDRSPESVAWHRETGAIAGLLNRAERRSRS